MGDTEEYFPRGGKKPTTTYFKQSANFLGAAEKGEKKKKKPKKKSEGDDGYLSDEGTKEIDQSFKNCAFGLSYKTVKEGLLILGRVKNVLETKIIVSLPCRLIGYVMACHISEPYNKELEAYVNDKTDKVLELSQMFRPGQFIAVKVLEVKDLSLMLSVMPQHVNGQMLLKDLQKGNLIQAAVSSVEDHGYVMDIGVSDTTAFLPKTNTNPELELDVGMVCWCNIKSSPSPGGGVVTLSNELVSLQNSWLRHKTSGPMLPGSNLDFLVDTPLENGIEGHVFGDSTAYVQRQHADTVRGKKPALGQKIRARLLYVMPTRNTPFLTMKNIFDSTFPDLGVEQQLKDGQIIEEAQVLKITGRSIHFRLGGGCFGTMSLKRIQVDEDLTDEEVVAKSYPIGSTHKVRVLCYNLSDYVYSVTDQPDVVSEKYFNFEQLRSGEIVDATVKTVAENHVLLNVGRVSGYVSQAHLFDSGILVDSKKGTTSNPKKKYKVGQAVKARVLAVDPGRQTLFLTLKPSLLSPDLQVLCSYEQAVTGKAYTGVIKTIRDYILVSFFNNVTAYIPRQFISKEPLENIAQAFHVGQIVNCTILRLNAEEKKMSGSFTTQPFTPNNKKEKPNKRKAKQDEEVANNKTKTDQTQVKEKKKKQSTEEPAEQSNTENKGDHDSTRKKKKLKQEQTDEVIEEPVTKKDKKKKAKQNIEEQQKIDSEEEEETPVKEKRNKRKERKESKSEESDAIDTDFDLETVFEPLDALLLDMSECTTSKHYKKKVASLLKSINNRSKRIAKIDRKIAKLEEKGLNSKTKLFHTAMQTDRILVKERIARLMEALGVAQAKLKEFGVELKQEFKKEKKSEEKTDKVGAREKTRDKLEVKVAESLEPALEAPSAQDFWSASVDGLTKTVQEEEESSSEDEEKDQPKKKRKKLSVAEKLAKVRDEEERVREMERRATASENQPQSSEQFERALLANPNSSQLWIAYMAFYLQATEVEKARKIGRNALATISFREPLEKFNMQVALLSIECRFGTKESLQKTLEEALQTNEPFDIHSKLLDIYVETSKHQELSALVELMMRKYKRETRMYTLCGAACFKLGLVDKARQVMQKAISVLEKKEHVPVLVQFALLESRSGSRERAEALFEQVLAVYPARVDVCAAYVDMLLKNKDHDHIRQVMERMTSQKLPARKMKVLYKKWIEIEEKIGDQEQVDKIRQRAMEYIEKAKF